MANRKEKQTLTVSEGESEALYTLEVIKYKYTPGSKIHS